MATKLKTIEQNQVQKEILINENFNSVSNNAIFSNRNSDFTGLYYQYYGGTFLKMDGTITNISDGQIRCEPSKTNYVSFNTDQFKMEVSQTGYTDGNIIVAKVICDASKITSVNIEKITMFYQAKNPIYAPSSLEFTSSITASNEIAFNSVPKFYDLTKCNFRLNVQCTVANGVYKVDDEAEFLTEGKKPLYYLDKTNNRIRFFLNNNDVKIWNGSEIVDVDRNKFYFKLTVFK